MYDSKFPAVDFVTMPLQRGAIGRRPLVGGGWLRVLLLFCLVFLVSHSLADDEFDDEEPFVDEDGDDMGADADGEDLEVEEYEIASPKQANAHWHKFLMDKLHETKGRSVWGARARTAAEASCVRVGG